MTEGTGQAPLSSQPARAKRAKKGPGSPAPRYLKLAEAATYLSLSRDTLYRLVDARRIPFIGINVSAALEGREPKRLHIRFDMAELDKFMARQAVVPPDALRWRM